MSECQLVINAHGLGIWQSGGDRAHRAVHLAVDDPEAPAQLAHWLERNPARCTLIADLAEERHIVEQLPHASRADHQLIIRRRLAQHYPDIPFTCVRPLPRPPHDNLRKPVLLAALTRPALLDPWVNVLGASMRQGKISVRALTSVPFLLERWYRRQRGLPAQSLLLTLGGGGMRQTLFRERRLCFARVIPARADTLAECASVYATELTQTLAWLASQHLTAGQPAIRILAPHTALPLLHQLTAHVSSDIELIDLDAHLPAPTQDDAANSIIPLVLREARHGRDFARYVCPPLQPAQDRLICRGMIGATALCAVAALAVATQDFVAATALDQDIRQATAAQGRVQDELRQLNARLPANAVALDTLAPWLDRAEALTHSVGIAPETVLQAVAALMDDAPWAELETLHWQIVPPATAQTPSTPPGHVELTLNLILSVDAPHPLRSFAVLESAWKRHDRPLPQIEFDPASARLRFTARLPLPPPAAEHITP
ncbi:hypothetical protein AGMMS49543_20530 [Betaproteobacteria bacterium]|nr:hypothetical protein AGMMS49543_20530 [Betaproteobacteria bacterium]GHU17482.1 hypothetical protein AGMMS50243_05790 [Betaproteobacteria bacterium]